MKNKILITVLTLCFLLTPFGAFAQDAANTTGVLSEAAPVSVEAEVFCEYRQDEQNTPDDLPQIGCKAAYVADPESGKVFFEKNAHRKMYPASTTKLLTALLVLENCTMEETATVSRRAVNLVPDGYVRANLRAGEQFSVLDLLRVLLIPSANDAAFVLAEHVGGSVKAFAKLCNKRAAELGCEKLHFVNPNGIHDDDHYCTAYDLYLIAKECQKYDVFNEIVQMKSVSLHATAVYGSADRTFQNTNQLLNAAAPLYYVAGCTGMKTGYTEEAGQCMVASSTQDDLNLISVVLGGTVRQNGVNERFSDSKTLLSYVYDHYSRRQIAQKGASLAQVTVAKATRETESLDIIIQADITSVAPNDLTDKSVEPAVDLPAELEAPIHQNQVLGTVTYRVDGLVYTTDLVASHEVIKKPYWLYNLLVLLALIPLIVLLLVIVEKRKEARRVQQRRRRQVQNGTKPDVRFRK